MKQFIRISSNFILGLLFTLCILSIGVIVTIHFRPLYYHDIKALNIEDTSGYSYDVIRKNYDALIDYCSPFHQKPLQFPDLPSSEHGIQHFKEVKQIFVFFYVLAGITAILLILFCYYKAKKHDTSYLKTSAIMVVILPALVTVACMFNFNQTFTLFHRLFFRNDYWIFDPVTDPVIQILPQQFFLHCAYLIVGIILIGALLLFLSYRNFGKRY